MYQLAPVLTLCLASAMSHAACNPNITPTAPNSRYELVNSGSEVKDLQTGLIWQRCSVGQAWNGTACAGNATTTNWTNALQTVANMGDGWRVPNIKELDSLIEQACYSPSINETYFPNTVVSSYWSSSPVAGNSYNAWLVDFYSGDNHHDPKFNSYYVRLMRASQ